MTDEKGLFDEQPAPEPEEEIVGDKTPPNWAADVGVEDNQQPLFTNMEWWRGHWKEMPEFTQEKRQAFKLVHVHIQTQVDLATFNELMGTMLSGDTASSSMWYPDPGRDDVSKMRWVDGKEAPK